MDLRKHMEYLVKIGDDICTSHPLMGTCEDDCPFHDNSSRDCFDHEHRVELAKQWLADHPETPTETDYRKMCRYIIENDGSCPAGRDGFPACSSSTCELCSDNCYPDELKKRAQAWLADHPEHSAEPERYYKGATRGDTTYSLSLSTGRISLFRWHGKDSESMDFGGTIEDFNQFDDERPEEWFDVAAKMIGERK